MPDKFTADAAPLLWIDKIVLEAAGCFIIPMQAAGPGAKPQRSIEILLHRQHGPVTQGVRILRVVVNALEFAGCRVVNIQTVFRADPESTRRIAEKTQHRTVGQTG